MSAVRTLARVVLPLIAVALAPAGVDAQQREMVGYVVAVVGDSVILNYDVEEDLYRIAAQGQQMPQGEALEELRAELLQTRVDQLVLLQAAQRDTALRVDDSAIAGAVQE
ncbi:MAG: SurA N-terminal domain-containing protein, partial [Longimicrobiales bacterium]